MIHFRLTREFIGDFKKLTKKYRTLNEDLERFKKFIIFDPIIQSKNFAILYKSKNCLVCKARFHCKCINKSYFRIIYAYYKETNEVEFIDFIELYAKGDKSREDKDRIENYLKRYPI